MESEMNAAAETILSAVRDRGIAALFEPEMISLAAGMGSIDWIADQAGATDDQIGEWKTKIDLFKQANGQPGNGGPEFAVSNGLRRMPHFVVTVPPSETR